MVYDKVRVIKLAGAKKYLTQMYDRQIPSCQYATWYF